MLETKPRLLESIPDLWHIPATEQELALFTLPFRDRIKQQAMLDDTFETAAHKYYDSVLLIGRFQPIHYGHIFLSLQGLQIAKKITIGIGSSNVKDKDNPWSKEMRKTRWENVVDTLGIGNRINDIVFLPDYNNDDVWLTNTIATLDTTGGFNAVIGNNGPVNELFKWAGYPIVTTKEYHREAFQGKEIRKVLRKKYGLPC